MKEKTQLSKSSLWGYAAFGFGGNCLGGILGSFLTLYLTDNLLLSSGFIAGLMLAGRISNAITEFLFGVLIDRVKGKHGARSWILGTAFLTALPVFMVFNTPLGLSELGRKIWVVVSYLMHISVFGAAISIAYAALLVKITKDPNTRVKLTNLNNLLGQVASLLTSSYGIPILMYFGGYQKGYFGMTFIFSMAGFIGMFLTGLLCKEESEEVIEGLEEEKEKLHEANRIVPFKESLSYVFNNKYAFPMIGIWFFYTFLVMFVGSVTIYFIRDVMGNAGYMTQLSYAKMIPGIVIALIGLVPMTSARFGKRLTMMGSSICIAAGYLIMLFAPASLPVVFVGNVLVGIGTAYYGTLINAVVADVADYVNRKNNIDVSGTVSSVSHIGMRIGMALGSVGITVLLSLGHYDAAAANAGLAQPASMIMMEKVGYIIIPMICGIILAVISGMMDVEKSIAQLEEKA